MTFAPAIPGSGLSGWTFLKATLPRQIEVFNLSPNLQRDVARFKSGMADVKTLDDLMANRSVLKVALGAFGLGDEINKQAFVRKVLEEGTDSREAFAVRLNNPNYLELADRFRIVDGRLDLTDSAITDVSQRYLDKSFEESLGSVAPDMRLALNFEREIGKISDSNPSEDTGWFRVMGSLPLREVFETAFSLPTGFSQLDLDRQKTILADKAEALFGSRSVSVFSNSETSNALIRRFLVQRQIEIGPSSSTPGSAALTLLTGGLGSGGIANLLLANVQT